MSWGSYTYTLETLIQAGRKGIPMVSVPIDVNTELRPSRLMAGPTDYIRRSIATIIRMFVVYKPLRFFTVIAVLLAVPGLAGIARFLYFYSLGTGSGHIQSLVISGALIGSAAIVQVGGLLADVVAANRLLLEDIRSRQLRSVIGSSLEGGHGPGQSKSGAAANDEGAHRTGESPLVGPV